MKHIHMYFVIFRWNRVLKQWIRFESKNYWKKKIELGKKEESEEFTMESERNEKAYGNEQQIEKPDQAKQKNYGNHFMTRHTT